MLSFHTTYSEDLNLKFDCVIGKNVSHKFPTHIHNSLCIGLVTKGKRMMILSGKVYTINQGEIFVININQPHGITLSEPHDYIAITIKGLSNCNDFSNLIKSPKCTSLFYQLYHAIEQNNEDLSNKWIKIFHFLSTKYTLKKEITSEEKALKNKALEYIKRNYRQPISIEDIAKQACMSTFHFCRQFKQYTGISPHNYLKLFRLSQSYSLLQKHTPVFDTAIEIGFYDSSHFIKTFQSYMAATPKEYQDSIITK